MRLHTSAKKKRQRPPTLKLRFRSLAEYQKVKKAAECEGLSLNKFILSRASLAANEVLQLKLPCAPFVADEEVSAHVP